MPPVKKGVYGPRGDRWREYTPKKAAYMREWRKRNWAKTREYNKKSYQNRRFSWGGRNLTKEGFEKLIEDQNNSCAICKDIFIKTPHIDHDHARGNVRGLLCNNCNTGIGKLRESPDIFRSAIEYIENWNKLLQTSDESSSCPRS